LDRFLAVPTSYSGQCVRSRGYIIGPTFFDSLESYYASRSKPFPAGVIGLYREPSSLGAPLARRYGDIAAVASTCRERADRLDNERKVTESERPGEVLITTDDSFCAFATADTPILYVSAVRDVSGAPFHLSGPAADREYGTLVPLERNEPNSERALALISDWFEAARERRFDYWHVSRSDVPKLTDPTNSPIAFVADNR
jgi:hypothetical protein